MKAEQLRSMTDAELVKKLSDLKAELFNLRFSHATGSLTNPLQLNVCKKNIAQVKTIIRERELGLSQTVKAPVKEVKAETKKTAKSATKSETKTKTTSAKKAESKKA